MHHDSLSRSWWSHRLFGKFHGVGEMNFKNLATGAALALGIASLSVPAAHADVILNYTGNYFTFATLPIHH